VSGDEQAENLMGAIADVAAKYRAGGGRPNAVARYVTIRFTRGHVRPPSKRSQYPVTVQVLPVHGGDSSGGDWGRDRARLVRWSPVGVTYELPVGLEVASQMRWSFGWYGPELCLREMVPMWPSGFTMAEGIFEKIQRGMAADGEVFARVSPDGSPPGLTIIDDLDGVRPALAIRPEDVKARRECCNEPEHELTAATEWGPAEDSGPILCDDCPISGAG